MPRGDGTGAMGEVAEWGREEVVDKAEAEWAGRLQRDPAETALVLRAAKSRRIS